MVAAAATSMITIRDKIGSFEITLNLDPAIHTPQQIIEHLLNEGHINRTTPDGQTLTFRLATSSGQEIGQDEPLASKGVTPGDTITLLSKFTQG